MTHKNIAIILYCSLCLTSCATSRLGNGITADGRPVCLSDCNNVPAAINEFKRSHPLETERDEIDYMLFRIRSANTKMYRNGTTYDGPEAARFLRWKLGWWYKTYHEVIDTDEAFVAKVVSGSKKSGEPYQVILPDGSRHYAQSVMQNELNFLNSQNMSDTATAPTLR